MKIFMFIPVLVFLVLSCSGNPGSVSNHARSNLPVHEDGAVEQGQVDSTDIGNGHVVDSTDIGNGQTPTVESGGYELICVEDDFNPGTVDCAVQGDDIVSADWSIDCPVEQLGHPNGDKLKIRFNTSTEGIEDCEVTVVLEDTNKQQNVKRGKAKGKSDDDDEVLDLSQDDSDDNKGKNKNDSEDEDDIIWMDQALRDIEGGIIGDFDVTLYS